MTTPVLLFAHGAGFCKEIWDPIIRRMKETSLLRLVDFVRVDLPFHGVDRDNSEIAQVDEHGPHVTHPANNAIALASNALLTKAKEFSQLGDRAVEDGGDESRDVRARAVRANLRTPTSKGPDRPYNFMADVTLKRAWKWDSREAAVNYFENWKSFSAWDRESLASWLQGAVVPDDSGGDGVVLACHPAVEASIYCGGRLWLSEHEQARPKCVTSFHSGSRTRLYRQEIFEDIAGRLPEIYKLHAPMVGNSHLMVLEDPEACAKAIVSDLDTFKCFSTNAVEFVTYDQPYHGVNRDTSVTDQVYHNNDDPKSPRVKHPMNNWVEITADAAWEQVQKLQETEADGGCRPLIGIGHSMGAAALWATEARHPGTFHGLILFEPIYGEIDAAYDKKADFLVAITLARERKWPSMDAAVSHFENWKNFSTWDRETLSSWIKGAVVFDEELQAAVLACDPLIEASVYAGSRLCLTEDELAAPRCPITFQSGDRTKLFDGSVFDHLALQYPTIYKNHKPLRNTSHLLVFEDVAATTTAILTDVTKLLPTPRL